MPSASARPETEDRCAWPFGAHRFDDGDALALTFAYPVERRNWEDDRRIQEKLALRKRRYL